MRTRKHQQGVCNIDKKENNNSVSGLEKFSGRSMGKISADEWTASLKAKGNLQLLSWIQMRQSGLCH